MPVLRRSAPLRHDAEDTVMSQGEMLFLTVALATFGGFGLWLAYNSWRYARFCAGKPVARYADAPAGTVHGGAD